MITIGDMCKVIERSQILTRGNGTRPTAEEIYNYSHNGELHNIWYWYELAQSVLDEMKKLQEQKQ